MPKFILATLGTGGDLYPIIHLGKELLACGHEVTVISNLHFEGIVKSHGFAFAPLYLDKQAADNYQIFESIYRYITDERCHSANTVMVSNQNLFVMCQTIAEVTRIPYGVMFMAPYFLSRISALETTLNTGAAAINQYRASLGLPPVSDWKSWMKTSRWKIGVWPEWFAPGQAEWIFPVTPVGFMYGQGREAGEIPKEVKEYLTDGEAPVLITHGTSKPADWNFFFASIEACKKLGRKCIILTPHYEVLRDHLAEGVRSYEHIPFAHVLPHVGAIIHHGGIGTLGIALAAGVPQLTLAYGYDRPDNGARIRNFGLGESLLLSQWRPEFVERAIRHITSPAVRERCRQFSLMENNRTDPAVALCKLITSS